MTRSFGSSLFLGCLLTSTLLSSRAHATAAGQSTSGQSAGDDSPTDSALDTFVGSARQSIEVSVPSYHGLEPHLSIAYDSSAGNGLPGVGWHFRGFGVIERVNATKGAPAYDATDTFLLDGMQLIDCPTQPVVWSGYAGAYPMGTHRSWSPSCITGGTHSTLIENYQRIRFDGASNVWTVTQSNGTTVTYAPILTPSGKPSYRWGVSKAQDTSGNTVTYTWTNPSATSDAYPSSVTYGPYMIAIRTEARPDSSTFTDGTMLRTITDRLREVYVGSTTGVSIRSYSLSYTTSTLTGRSLLTSVTQYGRDGSALPPSTFTYLDGAARPVVAVSSYPAIYGEQGNGMGPMPLPNDASRDTDAGTWSAADVTGDGASDIVHFSGTDTVSTWIGVQDGRFTKTKFTPWAGYPGSQGKFITGDQDGDGKADLLHLGGTFINTWISLGNGTYSVKQLTLPAGTSTSTGLWMPGDFNGDGKLDLLHYSTSGSTTTADTWLSSGNGVFSLTRSYSPTLAVYPLGGQIVALDVNGDGVTDIVHLTTDVAYTWLGSPSGAWAVSSFRPSAGYSPTTGSWQAGDFNGDGKSDLAHIFGSSIEIWTSLGNGQYVVNANAVSSTTGTWFAGDFNGDGRSDLVNVGSDQLTIALWTLGSGGLSSNTGTMTPYANGSWMNADARGDGRATLLHVNFAGGHPSNIDTWGSDGPVGNLLASSKNATGGILQYGYTPSSRWTNTNSPSVQLTVSSIAANDGRGTVGTTTFQYAGGLVDRQDRRFLGFHYVKKTLPSNATGAGPIVETWYHQDYGSASKPEVIDRRDAAGHLLSAASSEYSTNGGEKPYISRETGVWKIAYDGTTMVCPSAGCKRTYTSRTFDMYGVPTVETFYGDYDVAGDERTVSYGTASNTTTYVVGLPYSMSTYAGIGFGQLLEQTLYYYDNSATLGAVPARGLPTKTAKWESVSNTYVTSTAAFDAYGNRVAITNAVGATNTITFDASYHLFPSEVVQDATPAPTCTMGPCPPAVVGRISSALTVDPWCGGLASVYDENNKVTTLTVTFDAFCREASRTSALAGSFQRTLYQNQGDPKAQYTETQSPGVNGASFAWTRTYVDGFGRTYRKMSIGPSTGQEIITDTVFDARGLAQKSTPAYYANETPVWITATYDALDRPSGQTYPDGTKTTTTYGVRSTTKIDAMGRQTVEDTDAYGNIVKHTEKSGVTMLSTTYRYDVRGNLIELSDSASNKWSYSFNSLGQKTGMVDPDMGKWLYRYDAAGQLVEQVDALGQHETFAYDLLGRKTQKTTLAGTSSPKVYTWKYDEARPGYYNIGQLTSTFSSRGRNGFLVTGDSRTMNYDIGGRLVSTTSTIDGKAYTTSYGFDVAGRPLWTTLPDGDVIGSASAPVAYDAASRPIAIPGFVNSVVYDARGQMTKRVNANGTITTTSFSHDRGFVTGIATNDASGRALQQSTFDRQADGRIVRDNSTFAGQWTFAYDALGRLASASNALRTSLNQTWTYDAIGNMTQNSRIGAYTYPAPGAAQPHAVQAAGSNRYTYDANGNMVLSTTAQVTYDPDNRPVSITAANGTTTFVYDGDGTRLTKTVGGATTTYLGDAYEVTAGVATKYVTLNGTSVAKRVGLGATATTTWIHTDRQGSVECESDGAGREIQRVLYRPYGGEASRTTSAPEPLSYIGQRKDESGFLFLHARYYDPELGRFLSPDPTVPDGSTVHLNRYAYSSNDPVNSADPGGYDDMFAPDELFGGIFNALTFGGYGAAYAWDQAQQTDDFASAFSTSYFGAYSMGTMYAGLGFGGFFGDSFGLGGDMWSSSELGGLGGFGDRSFNSSFFDVPTYGMPSSFAGSNSFGFGTSSALGDLDMGSSLTSLPTSSFDAAFADFSETSFSTPFSEAPAAQSSTVFDYNLVGGLNGPSIWWQTNNAQYLANAGTSNILIPEGATGPVMLFNKGDKFSGVGWLGGSGGGPLDARVTDVRFMLPSSSSPDCPFGRVTYMNQGGQAVDPFTGKTVAKSDPLWHIARALFQ